MIKSLPYSMVLFGLMITFDTFALSIENMDPLGNAKLTKTLPNETFEGKIYRPIRLDGGLQLHPSCHLELHRINYNVEDYKKKMNNLMHRMLDRIIKCAKTYPELKIYLEQSISQYRRQIVKCDPPHEMKGLVPGLKDLNLKYKAYNDGNIGISNSLFLNTMDNFGQLETYSVFFHELLHSTDCNNRRDHNQIEAKAAKAKVIKGSCEENTSMDRVTVVTSLCMGDELNSSDGLASVILAKRMNICGTDRGCRDLFTANGNNLGFTNKLFNKSSDLDEASATRLCQRIKDDGMCFQQGKFNTDANPEVKEVRKRLRDRLAQLLPAQSNVIPSEIIGLYPSLVKKINSLKENKCFKRNFYISSDKPNEINALRTNVQPMPLSWWADDFGDLSDHIGKIKKDYNNFISSHPDHACKNVEIAMKSILADISSFADKDETFTYLNNIISDLVRGELPRSNLRKRSPKLVKLLGEELVQDYLKTMDKFHYESPSFNCVDAGLSPFRTMEAALRKPDLCEQ